MHLTNANFSLAGWIVSKILLVRPSKHSAILLLMMMVHPGFWIHNLIYTNIILSFTKENYILGDIKERKREWEIERKEMERGGICLFLFLKSAFE